MQAYAVENKEELFSKRKSLESAHGVFGFRTGTPEAEEPERFYLGSSNQHLQGIVAAIYPYNGRAGKRQTCWLTGITRKLLSFFPKIGVQVVQEETFYVEPKKENDAQSA